MALGETFHSFMFHLSLFRCRSKSFANLSRCQHQACSFAYKLGHLFQSHVIECYPEVPIKESYSGGTSLPWPGCKLYARNGQLELGQRDVWRANLRSTFSMWKSGPV